MKSIVTFLFLVIAVSFSIAQNKKNDSATTKEKIIVKQNQPIKNNQSPTAPIIKFKTLVHDFGTLNKGDLAEYDFEFVNEGVESLMLKNVQTGCGCTIVNWSKAPILKGEHSIIKVSYDTKSHTGGFNKAITVESNSKNGTMILNIRGIVK